MIDFGPSELGDNVSIADPATHLVVLKQGRYIGFRSNAAGGKMLQVRKRGGSKLCFFNFNFGINEQWETDDEPQGDEGWSTSIMQLRNRRLPSFILTVEVMRVPSTLVPGYTEGAPPPSVPPSMPTSPGTHLLPASRMTMQHHGGDDEEDDSPNRRSIAAHPLRESSNTEAGYTTQQSPGEDSVNKDSPEAAAAPANGHGHHANGDGAAAHIAAPGAEFAPEDNDTVPLVSRMVQGYEQRIQEDMEASSVGGASLSGAMVSGGASLTLSLTSAPAFNN